MKHDIGDAIAEIYKKVYEKLTQQQIDECSSLLKKVTDVIVRHIVSDKKLHNEHYSSNEEYKEFIDNIFKEKPQEISRLQLMHELPSNINVGNEFMANMCLFGLPFLTKKLVQASKAKKVRDYLSSPIIYVLMAFNFTKSLNLNFSAILISLLIFHNITLKTFKQMDLDL